MEKINLRLVALSVLLLGAISLSKPTLAQSSTEQTQEENAGENKENTSEDLTIQGQFSTLYRVSTSYNERGVPYRVVKFELIKELQKSVADSLKIYYTQDDAHQATVNDLNNKLEVKTVEAERTRAELDEALLANNSISVFGNYVAINTYRSVMWIVHIVLAALVVILFMMFKRGSLQVRDTKKQLKELQEEYEGHRKNALTREQKLARELMDVKLRNNLI